MLSLSRRCLQGICARRSHELDLAFFRGISTGSKKPKVVILGTGWGGFRLGEYVDTVCSEVLHAVIVYPTA